MKKGFFIGLALIIGFAETVQAQEKVPMEFVQLQLTKAKDYTIVFLTNGAKLEIGEDPDVIEKTQLLHLQHLFTLHHQKKLLLFGPLTDVSFVKGILIFDLTDPEEVKKLMEDDPYVKAGYSAYEIHPWYGIPGQGLTK